MVYKYKICLDWDKNPLLSNKSESYILSTDLVLNITATIDKEAEILNIMIAFRRPNGDIVAICEEGFPYHYYPTSAIKHCWFDACKTYILEPINIHSNDVYMVKIFIEDIMTQSTTGYGLDTIKKEIQFVDFKKPFEVMDLCVLMLDNIIDDDLRELFTKKALHFGFKSLDELIALLDEDNEPDIATRLVKYKPLSMTSLVNSFYAMVLFDLKNGRIFAKLFRAKMRKEYTELTYSRMDELKPYFEL